MQIILNYALSHEVKNKETELFDLHSFPSDMKIDYVKVYKLKCDCENDVNLQNNQQLAAFNFQLKRKIILGSQGNTLILPSGKTVFRASEAIIINGGFQTPLGTELELITQPCPDN